MKYIVLAVIALIAHSITVISLTTLRGVGGSKFLAVLGGTATVFSIALMSMVN